MGKFSDAFLNFKHRLRQLSIYKRIAIGNSLIIIVGAIGGTLITRHLAIQAADLGLILLFATLGITFSVWVNNQIIKGALHPMVELRQLVGRVRAGQTGIDSRSLQDTDPDVVQLASALSSLVNQLDERNRQLRALSKRAINAQEEERKRIALSLHDDTGQSLSMLIINLDRLESRIPQEETDLKTRLVAARQLAARSLGGLRKIVSGLRPTILDDLGLVPAIRWYARANLEDAGIRVSVNVPQEPQALPPELNSTLFRITQEAINNILRHSGAKSVAITLSQNEKTVNLQIEDDGQGFNVTRVSEQAIQRQQWGLLGIQERAELVGGTVRVDSEPGRGTCLLVNVPLPNRRGA